MTWGQVIGAAMPAGFAGDIARGEFDFTTETRVNDATAPVLAFGVPVKFTSTGAVSPATAAADVVGFFGPHLRTGRYVQCAGREGSHDPPAGLFLRCGCWNSCRERHGLYGCGRLSYRRLVRHRYSRGCLCRPRRGRPCRNCLQDLR